jgi:hypothetical protein
MFPTMNIIELAGLLFGNFHELPGSELKALLLEPADYLTGRITLV